MTDLRIREGRRVSLRAALAALPLPLFAALLPTALPAQAADDTTAAPEVVVEATRLAPPRPLVLEVLPADLMTAPAADAGALMTRIPGVAGGRMGAHGTDLSIRGQSQDRIAVINDGAYTFGGCPNRMDPPTASMAPIALDVLTVRKGYQSVTDGPPAPGGAVIGERLTPRFTEAGVRGVIDGAVDSNGRGRQGGATVTAGAAPGYGRAFVRGSGAEDYKDGQGRSVRSGYTQYGGGLEAGWTYGPDSVFALSAEADRVDDLLFAGAGMDSPYTDTDTYRARLRHGVQDAGTLRAVEASAYGSLVNHLMDNYTLRTPGMMKMATATSSDTYGGRLAAELEVGGGTLTLGADHRTNRRDGTSRMGMTMLTPGHPATVTGYTWPDMSIADSGLFAEGAFPLGGPLGGDATTLTAGARVDLVRAKAGDAVDRLPAGMGALSARQLYQATYGTNDVSHEETNLSGLLRLSHDFGGVTAWAGASRAVRTADATERGIARSAGAGSWVGNPGLDPEKHHQLDIGAETTLFGATLSAAGWYDWAGDFITRDTARGQAGVVVADGRSIFRNVDAELGGVELGAGAMVADHWRLGATLAYTYGQNTTDNRPLYNIAPLSGTVEVAYVESTWEVGSRLRWAATQTRVDDDATSGSGLDVRKTPGHAVVDLFASYAGFGPLEVRAGVTNLLDQTYAQHLSRGNGFDPTVVQVNDPGRGFYLGGRVVF